MCCLSLSFSVQVQNAARPVRASHPYIMARDGSCRPAARDWTDVFIAQVPQRHSCHPSPK